MKRTMYSLSFDKAENAEREIRKFLLKEADIVRFTHRPLVHIKKGNIQIEVVIGSKKRRKGETPVIGNEEDRIFIKLLKELQKDFIKKITDDMLFYGIRDKDGLFTHYFYALSPKMKKRINENTLFQTAINHRMERFPFFEDPTFYKKKVMIGSVISHEPQVYMFLTVTEKKEFDRNGIEFD